MKAITLTQPWATLIAIGAKRFETRSWNTNYRGPMAIHAAKGLPGWVWYWYTQNEWARAALRLSSYTDLLDMPRGVIVATCKLNSTIYTELARDAFGLSETEIALGDYSPGRWAWELIEIHPLDYPVQAKGALGLWEWNYNVNSL